MLLYPLTFYAVCFQKIQDLIDGIFFMLSPNISIPKIVLQVTSAICPTFSVVKTHN